MSRKVSLSAILVFWLFVMFGPYDFWYAVVENPPRKSTLTLDDRGRFVSEIDKVSIMLSTGFSLLMFVGGAVGVYRKVRKEGARRAAEDHFRCDLQFVRFVGSPSYVGSRARQFHGSLL